MSQAPPNKQLERTVIRRRVRAASAPFHYALAARWTRGHAAAQLRRYTLRSLSQRCPEGLAQDGTNQVVARGL
jgi:hypothetical protein